MDVNAVSFVNQKSKYQMISREISGVEKLNSKWEAERSVEKGAHQVAAEVQLGRERRTQLRGERPNTFKK